ncbi:MAG: tRNA pseudouridine(55) synthase TruB [Chloroflexi bacterium]|nr:tRNA pseudouridine(55) synthase TruB [Chloroflexota bacterium]MBI2983280.1 tRNA pseudouridine(55) synthase TruB [Chloroflexota bacterium]
MLAVDKPSGWTSHDVVAVMRRILGTKRVGHGGTLDPLATGVLPILVGPATKYVDRLHSAPKVYAAAVRFGMETTTDDREGPARREAAVPSLGVGDLDAALRPFRGEISQVPPDRSAVKVEGRRAYAIARSGTEVRLEPRTVRVERLAIASWAPPQLRLLIVCGSGTYVRSLARDIGRSLGSAAHLGALRRLAVGALTVDRAADVGRLRAANADEATALLRPADDRLLDLDQRFRSAPAGELLGAWEAA